MELLLELFRLGSDSDDETLRCLALAISEDKSAASERVSCLAFFLLHAQMMSLTDLQRAIEASRNSLRWYNPEEPEFQICPKDLITVLCKECTVHSLAGQKI